ncbi:MAG: hypothetical protein VW268_07730 [Rhodospirillaceae bacterium]
MFAELSLDGQAGPKTRAAFKRASAKLGPARVKEGVALGQFERFADNAAAGIPTGGLAAKAAETIGPLFRKQMTTTAPDSLTTSVPQMAVAAHDTPARASPTEEGFGLQATINDLGRGAIGKGFQPILEDGRIGPKTEAALAQVLPAASSDDLTPGFDRNLSFAADELGA